MVKFSTALFVAALVVGPAVAFASEQEFTRDVAGQDPYERDLVEEQYVRDEVYDLFGRDIEELSERDLQELYERDPNFFKKIFGGVKKVLFRKSFEDEVFVRDLVELDERDPNFFKKVFGGVKKVLFRKSFEDEVFERDLVELDEREPLFGLAFKAAKLAAKGISKAVSSHNHHRKRDIEDDLYERDFEIDELD